MDNVKLVKLSTTEEIVAKVKFKQFPVGDITVTDPVMFVQNPQQPQSLMPFPWAPLAHGEIYINATAIVFVADVEPKLKDHYLKLISASKSNIQLVRDVPQTVLDDIKKGPKVRQ